MAIKKTTTKWEWTEKGTKRQEKKQRKSKCERCDTQQFDTQQRAVDTGHNTFRYYWIFYVRVLSSRFSCWKKSSISLYFWFAVIVDAVAPTSRCCLRVSHCMFWYCSICPVCTTRCTHKLLKPHKLKNVFFSSCFFLFEKCSLRNALLITQIHTKW